MDILLNIAALALLALELFLGVLVGYLLLLTGVSLFARRRTPLTHEPTTRFAVLVPAHDEELLLPALLASLAALDYPRALYDVHVVADNCADRTAELARQGGAVAHERFDDAHRGKGYALEWLLARVPGYDAYVIVDADSILSPNFLMVMNQRLRDGAAAVQGYYAVRDPAQSWGAALRYVALALVHYLRPLARSVLGGSVGLKGNGMCFTAGVLARHRWTADIVEDIAYHMALVRDGLVVAFAPDAVVWAEMPASLRGAQTQNVRWERGRLQMVRDYVPGLLRDGLRRRSFVLLDAAMEQIIPPFSVLVGGLVLGLLAGLALGALSAGLAPAAPLAWLPAALAAVLLAGAVVYTLAGLVLVRAPARIWLSLALAPVFVAWKLALYVGVLLGRGRHDWARTAREGER